MEENLNPESDHDLLIVIAEQTRNIQKMLDQFVTRREFAPVRAIVYGFVGLVLVSVMGGLITLLLKDK